MKPWLPRRSFPSRTTQAYLRTLNLRPKLTDILKIVSESHSEPEPERTRTRYTITPRIVEIPAPREKRSKQEEREILERVTRIEDTKSS
jgi:vacuolar-type H+-ATPase subunit F/Vma7